MFDLGEIEILIQAASSGNDPDATAILDRETGRTWLLSDYVDDGQEPPEDWDTNDRYLVLPDQQELDLGSNTARRFVEAHLPEHRDTFRDFFSRKGAFRRWRQWLEQNHHLEAWYAFEAKDHQVAIRAWLAEQGVEVP